VEAPAMTKSVRQYNNPAILYTHILGRARFDGQVARCDLKDNAGEGT
jgi:hypothetical protein